MRAVEAVTVGAMAAAPAATPSGAPKPGAAAALISQVTADSCRARLPQGLMAIVLAGSLARGEATFREDGGKTRLLGDADFLLVFRPQVRRPAPDQLATTGRHIESELDRRGVVAHTTLAAVSPLYFPALPRHIFTYELRNSGRVVWGDPQVLGLVPLFESTDLSREDAWRLLSNRMIEQMEATPETLVYSSVKFCLDLATSLLVFAGAYEPTYRARAARLAQLAAAPPPGLHLPFPIAPFSRLVHACTEWKLGDSQQILPEGTDFHKRLVGYAHLLWRWELQALTKTAGDAPDIELFRRWRRMQPLSSRLRGWLFVLRKSGWMRSAAAWPRWIGLALRASPRYCVYFAAAQLMFQGDRAAKGRPADIRRWLPVPHPERRLASDVAWNYHEFLEGTRA